MEKRFVGRKIVLGITGSIAAYKACEVVRMLQREGAEVRTIMTEAAARFVHPLTFETLTGSETVISLFPKHRVEKTRHIHLAEWAECLLICPATANIIGKIASGIADDFLSTEVMASRAPVVIAPAMDYQMVVNPIYLENCEKLRKHGYYLVETDTGHLASGASGPGRLADYPAILAAVKIALLGSRTLKGRKVLVSAGPTREYLDPVRYISNPSSGKMGFALAEEAALRGAEVTLITGPVNLHHFTGVKRIDVISAADMAEAVQKEWPSADILIMASAVADFTVQKPSEKKLKKERGIPDPAMIPTVDILKSLPEKPTAVKVGFALETDNDIENAKKKLNAKDLDMICANNPLDQGAGFEVDTNRITIIQRNGDTTALELMPKWKASNEIMNRIEVLWRKKNK